ncbi:MAG: DUF3971 domain-containing protein [Candidatus Midichloriaceae bacterium]
MSNSIKSSDMVYLKKLLVILKFSLAMLLFTVVGIIAYLSFFGSKHLTFIDNIIKHNIEKNLDQINISKIRTGIALDLKDASIVLSLEDLELSYKKSAVFIAPDLRLKFDIIGLILRRPNQMFKGIILDEKKIAIVYDKSQKNKELKQEKIPITNVINILKKYQYILKDQSYIIENFKINIKNGNGDDYNINLKNLEFKFDNINNIEVNSLIQIDNAAANLKISAKTTSGSAIDIKGSILSDNQIEKSNDVTIGQTNIKTNFKINFDTRLSYLNFTEKINFSFMQSGITNIANSNFFQNDLDVNALSFKGEILNNFSKIDIPYFTSKIDNQILVKGGINYEAKKLIANLNVSNLSTKEVLNIWSNNLLSEVHLWLLEHLKGGEVSNLILVNDFNEQVKSSLTTSVNLKNAHIKYLKNAPTLTLNTAEVKFTTKNLVISSEDGKILNSSINNVKAEIEDLNQEKLVMKFNANILGSISEQLKIANMHYKLQEQREIEGMANTKINFVVPFYKVPTFEDLKFNLQSQLSDVIMSGIYQNYQLTNGKLEVNLIGEKLKISGEAKINRLLNIFVDADIMIKNNKNYVIQIDINDNLQNFQKLKIPLSNFFGNNANIRGVIKANPKKITSEFWADLYNTSVNIDALSIVKKAKLPGKIHIQFVNNWDNETKISKFKFKLPHKYFSGTGIIDDKIGELVNFKCSIFQNNVQGMVLNYDKVENLNRITLNGIKADLSEFSLQELVSQLSSDNLKGGGFFSFKGKADNLILKNNTSLHDVDISVDNQRSISVNISAFLEKNKPLRVYYNYPVLSITSPDAGAVLKALGITEKINEGDLEIKGSFETHKKFKGFIELNNFYALKTPALLNLLTITAPLTTLRSIIKNKGIRFYSFRCPVEYDGRYLEFDDCIAESKLLALKLSGNIDIETKYLNSRGVIVPQNIVNTIFKKVPFLNLFSGPKNEGMILSTLFNMQGYLDDDIKVSANYLSTLTPGFLRNIFKKHIAKPQKESTENNKYNQSKSN